MTTTSADIIARFSDAAPAEVAYSYVEAGSNVRKIKVLREFMAAQYPLVPIDLVVLVLAVKGINSRRMTIDGVSFDFTAAASA